MHFDPTITLGTILEIGTMVTAVIIAVYKLLDKISRLQFTLEEHGRTLSTHDAAIKSLMETVQRLIGRSENAFYERADHRRSSHGG